MRDLQQRLPLRTALSQPGEADTSEAHNGFKFVDSRAEEIWTPVNYVLGECTAPGAAIGADCPSGELAWSARMAREIVNRNATLITDLETALRQRSLQPPEPTVFFDFVPIRE